MIVFLLVVYCLFGSCERGVAVWQECRRHYDYDCHSMIFGDVWYHGGIYRCQNLVTES